MYNNSQTHHYYLVNKPFNMVSQFVSNDKVNLLSQLKYSFPIGTHAIGRLDNNSEGLLLLTTNKKVTKLLFQGIQLHQRTYAVMVKGVVSIDTLLKIVEGIEFKIGENKFHKSAPCIARIIDEPIFNFASPYIKNTHIDYTWLSITLTEGKYHQVRKITAAVGHKCVRLVRTSIELLQLGNLTAGEVKMINESDFFSGLNI